MKIHHPLAPQQAVGPDGQPRLRAQAADAESVSAFERLMGKEGAQADPASIAESQRANIAAFGVDPPAATAPKSGSAAAPGSTASPQGAAGELQDTMAAMALDSLGALSPLALVARKRKRMTLG